MRAEKEGEIQILEKGSKIMDPKNYNRKQRKSGAITLREIYTAKRKRTQDRRKSGKSQESKERRTNKEINISVGIYRDQHASRIGQKGQT
jgi:hypothetical protein